MSKTKAWFSAARLRTLPLSISGIITGSALAIQDDMFDARIFVFAILTTLALQILSNFANDYGDGVKGTDNDDRLGPMRALQSGVLQASEMRIGIIITGIITFLLALSLIYLSFGQENFLYSLFFIILGIAAITAAIKYTVGDSAYGYKGFGDLFVFLFFGWVSVVGVYFLYTQRVPNHIWLPASAIGLLCTAVLNLNNMRDQINDAKMGKKTLVVYLGAKTAKVYHYVLILGSLGLFVAYHILILSNAMNYLVYLGYVPLLIHLMKVIKNDKVDELDPELKKVALSTFLISLLFLAVSIYNA